MRFVSHGPDCLLPPTLVFCDIDMCEHRGDAKKERDANLFVVASRHAEGLAEEEVERRDVGE